MRRRQNWGRCGHKAGDSRSPEKLDKEEGPSPGASRGRAAPRRPDFDLLTSGTVRR